MSRHNSLYLLVAALAAVWAAPGAAQTDKFRDPKLLVAGAGADTAKHAAIRRLLVMQRLDSLVMLGIEEGLAEASPDPDMPAGFEDAVRARARQDVGRLIDRLVRVYDSTYTAEEITEMLSFYQTSLGRRMLETQLGLAQAIGGVSDQWALEVAGQVMIDLARKTAGRVN